MDEQKKYEVIKKLVDSQGNKDKAAITLGITSHFLPFAFVRILPEAFCHIGNEVSI